MRLGCLFVLVGALLAGGCGGDAAPKQRLRLATTTSTDNSGLLEFLLPPFEKETGIEVQVIAVGTGQALALGRRGDVDLVLVHAREREDQFVADGFGIDRRDVMANDFVIVGPAEDPARIRGVKSAAQALGRLGHLLGDVRYLEAAERTVKSSWAVMERYPHAHGTLLIALEEILEPVETVVIRGNEDSVDEWRHVATSTYTPRRLVFAIPDSEVNLPGILAERKPGDEHIAYVCQGTQCLAPVTKLEDLARVLRT